jgi:FAD:protein FMN transferase
MTSACVDLRRARPLLGTVVEIAATVRHRAPGHAAIDAAFAAVEQVQRLMSFHAAESDVSRLNRSAADVAIAVHPWTYAVLAAAADLRRASAGLFDVAIAPYLEARGILPRSAMASAEAPRKDDKVILLSNNHVRFSSPRSIDLGGIAKGFAVDRAVAALRAHGVARGLVNAGGDLFAFGAPQVVSIRDPRRANAVLARIAVADAAVASSARTTPGAAPSLIVDPRTGCAAAAALGATVLAPSCLTADALTKLVLLLGCGAGPILERYGARALVATPDGGVHVTDDWPEAQAHAA